MGQRLWHIFLGKARDPHDPALSHKLSLIAFLAWVGLGVDGLSSSAYGPEEAFRNLGEHSYIAILLALATAFTVFVISYTYSKLIEQFPHGGGGYVVATQLLGKPIGIVSGCALLVDYVLTITVSIASGGDAIFSLLPISFQFYKLPVEFTAIIFLIAMNLRGLKESVTMLVPFFLLFIVTHFILIFGGILFHLPDIPILAENTRAGFVKGTAEIGAWGLFLVFFFLLLSPSRSASGMICLQGISSSEIPLRQRNICGSLRAVISESEFLRHSDCSILQAQCA